MPLSPSPVALRNRRILVAVVASLLVAVGVMWWLSGADERRVNSACDTWLEQRSSLRTVLSETEEAVGRAQAEGSSGTATHFNNLDREMQALQNWDDKSPDVIGSLDNSGDASRLERSAASAFGFVESSLDELRRLIEEGEPAEVASWIPNVGAVFQMVDDSCLSAARSRNL